MPKKKLKKTKKTVDEKISQALDIPTESEVVTITPAIPVEGEVIDADIVVRESQPFDLGYATPGENPEIEKDYKESRQHLKKIREKAVEALDQMQEVAEQGEGARMYEVVGQLIKANLEVQKAEIELHKDMKALREQDGKTNRASHIGDVNSSVFVGTTKELLELKKAGKLPKQHDTK